MEQGLVPINSSTAITSASTVTNESMNESTCEQQNLGDHHSSVVVVVPSDDMMDLLRAIEMSRLQAVRENEQNIYRPNGNSSSQNNNTVLSSNDKIDYFNDLQQAIELSLRTKIEQELIHESTSLFFDDLLVVFFCNFIFLVDIESPQDDLNAAAVAATMPSLDLFSKF
jgi:hypothetical protein